MAIKSVKILSLQSRIKKGDIKLLIDHVNDYLSDSIYYLREKRDAATSLASISYAEGLLDAIRLLKFDDFNWNRDGKKIKGLD